MVGDADGNSPGGFLILNENFEIISKYGEADSKNLVTFSYDFWYQPYHNGLYKLR
jgi:selenium-binding protein 1